MVCNSQLYLHFSLFCVTASLESGSKPLESLVKGLNALVVALKVWSTKGEVSHVLHCCWHFHNQMYNTRTNITHQTWYNCPCTPCIHLIGFQFLNVEMRCQAMHPRAEFQSMWRLRCSLYLILQEFTKLHKFFIPDTVSPSKLIKSITKELKKTEVHALILAFTLHFRNLCRYSFIINFSHFMLYELAAVCYSSPSSFS